MGPRGEKWVRLQPPTCSVLWVIHSSRKLAQARTVELFSRQYKYCNKNSNSDIDDTASGFSAAACTRLPGLQDSLRSVVVIDAEYAPQETAQSLQCHGVSDGKLCCRLALTFRGVSVIELAAFPPSRLEHQATSCIDHRATDPS